MVLIEDFRRFWRIFVFFNVFVHSFERFREANGFETRSFSGFCIDPSKFSVKNVRNFGAWCKALPERDQKRSGRENHDFLQSVTWTCSKLHFSSIFVGYSSRIFGDFHGFSHISSFSRIVLHASRRQIASKHVHFLDSVWIRAIFG